MAIEREEFRLILENLETAIHIVDRGMKIIYANKYWETFSRGHIKREDMIGKSLFEVFPFLRSLGRDKEYKRVLETGESLVTEETTEVYGETIHTRTKKIPIKGATGRVEYIVTAVEDITEDVKLKETLNKRLAELSTVLEIDRMLIAQPDVSKVIELATARVHELLNADRTVFSSLDETKGIIKPVAAEGPYKKEVRAMALKLGNGFTGKVIAKGKGEILNDAHLSDVAMQVPGTPVEPESLLCVPLIFENKTLGALTVSRMGEGKHFAPDDLAFCEIIAAQIAIALQNARLHGQLKELVEQRTKELQEAYKNLKRLEEERREYISRLIADVTPTLNIVKECVSTLLVDEAAKKQPDRLLTLMKTKLDNLINIMNKMMKAREYG